RRGHQGGAEGRGDPHGARPQGSGERDALSPGARASPSARQPAGRDRPAPRGSRASDETMSPLRSRTITAGVERTPNRAMLRAVGFGDQDFTKPIVGIAIAHMNIPAVFVYGGTIKPGHYKGQDLTVVSAFEAVGQYSAHKLSEADLLEVERRACPGAGACGGMFTANTMSSAIEAMGMSLPYSSTMAAEDG